MARKEQLELDLFDTQGWGGRRDGAGRKPAAMRRDSHRRRQAFARITPCHMTLKVRAGLPSLRTASFVRAFEASIRKGCERGRFRVVQWSVQRDHLHLVVEAASVSDLGSGMKSVALRVVRAAQRVFNLGRRGAVLRDRSHVRLLRSPREVRRALAYVLLNARRHAAQRRIALDRRPARVDPASSGRWFDGWKAGSVADRDVGSPAVARPRSWLLAIGWRKSGLIDVTEIPGARLARGRVG